MTSPNPTRTLIILNLNGLLVFLVEAFHGDDVAVFKEHALFSVLQFELLLAALGGF